MLSLANLLTSLTGQFRQHRQLIVVLSLVISLSACSVAQTATPRAPVTLVIFDSPIDPTATVRPIRTLILPTSTSTVTPSAGTEAQDSIRTPSSQQPDRTATPPAVSDIPSADPMKTSDLLFLAGPRLMRWDHVTNFTSALAENVIEFSTSAPAKRSPCRSQKFSANGVQLYNLDILDLKEKQIHTLFENSPPLFQISLSPDGSKIAYLPQDRIGQVSVRSALQPSEPVIMGECRPANDFHCKSLLWSPDSRSIAWSDQEGIWWSSIRDNEPKLVIPNQVDIMDPENIQQRIGVSFGSLQWSPVGRFILAQVIPSQEGVRWFGIIDTLDGRLVNIPDSSEFARPCLEHSGSRMETCLSPRREFAEMTVPTARMWQIVPTRNDLLVLADNIELQAGSLPSAAASSSYENDYCINWLNKVGDSTYNAIIEAAGVNSNPRLYRLDIKEGSLQDLQGLPQNTGKLIWSPDGFGALVMTQDGQIFFIYTGSGKTIALSDVLGAEVEGFYWLPPMPRE
jgi:Tol biopolymer transport system component